MKDHGFTLVEMTVVLALIALVAGGVFTGQSLLKGAELRSVSVEFAQFEAATVTFKDRYAQLPGDIDDATAFWGSHQALCSDSNIPTKTLGTCNGNGDNLIV